MKSIKLNYKSILIVISAILIAMPLFSAAPKYNWKLASVLPESHPVHKTLLFFAEKVSEKTKGAVKITIYPAGQLGGEKDYLEMHKIGSIEISKISSAPLGQFSKTMQVVSLPFIWRNAEHQHAVLDGPIGKRLMDDLDRNGFKGLVFLDAGFRNITTRDKPVATPDDLKGMKIRVMQSKPLMDTINAFGATAVPMSQTEVYVALQQKVIDGWENNEPTVSSFKMQEVCKYFSYTRHTSIPDIMVMTKKTFDALPKNIQKAVEDAAKEAGVFHAKLWAGMIDDTVKQLKENGMIFNEVKDIKEFQDKAKLIYKEFEPIVGADLIEAIQKQK